jgi:hypothetical protein
MTLSKTYYPLPTLYSITDANLAYCKMLLVARSGVEFNVDTTGLNEGGGNYCLYTPSTGTITFYDQQPFLDNESINIVYDTNP